MTFGIGLSSSSLIEGRPFRLSGISLFSSYGFAEGEDPLLKALEVALRLASPLSVAESEKPFSDPVQIFAKYKALGLRLNNCDCTIVCERPKIAPYKAAIRASLTEIFSCSLEQIGLKAKTAEQMGKLGRGEEVGVIALVSLFAN